MLLALALGCVELLGLVEIMGAEYAVILVVDDGRDGWLDAGDRGEHAMGTLLASIGLMG